MTTPTEPLSGGVTPTRSEDEIVLYGVRVEGEDFSNRQPTHLSIGGGSRLVRCEFRRLRASGAVFGGGMERTEYLECLFDGSVLGHVFPGRARFVACSFRHVKVRHLRSHEAEFVDCVFSGTLKTVIFNGRVAEPDEALGRTHNEFRGNDFRDADLRDVPFRGGIDLDQQYLPGEPDYLIIRNAAEVLARVQDRVDQWPDEDDRSKADAWLWVRARESRDGQRDVFVRKSEIGRSREVNRRLIDLLEDFQSG